MLLADCFAHLLLVSDARAQATYIFALRAETILAYAGVRTIKQHGLHLRPNKINKQTTFWLEPKRNCSVEQCRSVFKNYDMVQWFLNFFRRVSFSHANEIPRPLILIKTPLFFIQAKVATPSSYKQNSEPKRFYQILQFWPKFKM